jgi:hypothetical protein
MVRTIAWTRACSEKKKNNLLEIIRKVAVDNIFYFLKIIFNTSISK